MNTSAIQALRVSLTALTGRDVEFANSLISQFTKKGDLSVNQWPWVEKLVVKAQPKPAPEINEQAIDLAPLQKLFAGASEGLKKPRVAFSCSAGEFVVSRAADNSRNPGHLYVKDVVGNYLGKVDPKGKLFINRDASYTHGDVFMALEAFASNPAERAAAYGHETGNCCFCSRALTDPRSVDVGYGPICADKWSLPWGE